MHMGLLKKHRLEIVFIVSIVLIYLLTRLLTLSNLPIFTDEAIYVRWAQIAKNDADWWFISLTDGKQPLFVWLTMINMNFVSDPLIAGRLISVISGLFTMLGLYLLSFELFKKKWIGLLSSLLYALYPFALVYDRMALYDSLVGTLSIFGLYLTVIFVKRLKSENAVLLGIMTGAAVLNKSSGFFILYLLPFSLLLVNFTKKKVTPLLTKFFLLSIVVVFITYVMYFILRLSPFFYIIDEKNAVFVYPLEEWIKHPFEFLFSNLNSMTDWFLRYFGIVFTILVLVSFTLKKNFREKLLLLIWFLAPFTALVLFGKTIYPRYILFMTLPLLPLVAYSIYVLSSKVKQMPLKILFIISIFVYPVFLSYSILTDFGNSYIPSSDRNQYLSSWPSGVGIKESLSLFKQKTQNEKISIYTAGTFGLLPYAYEMYLVDNKNVHIEGFWPVEVEIPQLLLDSAKKQTTYVVFYQPCPPCPNQGVAPTTWPLTNVISIPRLEAGSYFNVYVVKAQ